MDTQLLSLFVEVARCGSFAEVARRRRLDPSSVSRAIKNLETELALRLFQRSTRRLSLSDAGRDYLNRVEPLLEELQQAADQARERGAEPRGKVRIGSSTAFGQQCILPLLKAFRLQHAQIELELLLSDSVVDPLAEALDLSLRLSPNFDSSLVGIKLFDVRYRLCASPDWLASNQPPAEPEALLDIDCLNLSHADFSSGWSYRSAAGAEQQLPVRGSLLLSSPLALREAALLGLGPALLADWLVEHDIRHGRLLPLLEHCEFSAQNFDTAAWLLYPSRTYVPAKTRLCIEFFKQALQSGPGNVCISKTDSANQ
ncbi:LysR family transcriptional regulator [Agaribacterium haliotis]|uniref:LysR family transcriptional regulator n=1 Tax=Agaribacterium haliotis TaxID=2013869 RepID=UPI000BB5874E|nr:LysR family transcriptional regulator [Agaribacterium haliotis]